MKARKPLQDKHRLTAVLFSALAKNTTADVEANEKEDSPMPYSSKTIGLVISRLRIQKGLTQETLSGLSGISRSHLIMLET